jgi:SPP1 family predicted phage head-tail adaptor
MAVKLAIGRMDRRITLQRQVQGVGQNGEPTSEWAAWLTVWANAYSGSGRELEAARQISAEISTQFQIRWVDGLSATMRILWEGRYYDIDHFTEVGRRQRIDIFAKARVE